MADSRSTIVSSRRVPYALFSILAGAIGFFASFELLTEYIKTLVEPDYDPNCNISVLVTCGPNMSSWQGSIFGFSNTIIGVAAFMVPILIGVALLAGATFSRWFWVLYQLGLLGGFVLVCWLQFQSIYNINTLCPWCMVVWAVMIPLWWVSLFSNWSQGLFGGSATFRAQGATLTQWAWVFIVLNYIAIAAASQFHLNWLFTEFGIGSY